MMLLLRHSILMLAAESGHRKRINDTQCFVRVVERGNAKKAWQAGKHSKGANSYWNSGRNTFIKVDFLFLSIVTCRSIDYTFNCMDELSPGTECCTSWHFSVIPQSAIVKDDSFLPLAWQLSCKIHQYLSHVEVAAPKIVQISLCCIYLGIWKNLQSGLLHRNSDPGQFSAHRRDHASGQGKSIPSHKARKTEMVGCVPLEKLIHWTQQQLETLLQFFLDRIMEK